MKFFFDNMISPRFASALQQVGKDVVALRKRFPENTPDEDWIAAIAQDAPVLITADWHIRTRPLQRRALSQAGIVTLFLGRFFTKGSMKFWDQFVWLVRHWARMEETAAGLTRGSCMTVQQNGKLQPLPAV